MGKYLKEDEDIISKMDGPVSSDMTNLLNKLQIEATLRNRKSLVDSSRETKIFSIVLIVFALIQFIVALFQFLFSIQTSNNKWYGLFLIITLYIMVGYIFKKFDKIK